MREPSSPPLPPEEGLGAKGFVPWIIIAAVIVILDQLSKAAINSHFVYGESYAVTSFFNLVLVHNTGAAFSFLHDAGGMQRWLFSGIALIASVWIIWLLRKHQTDKLFCFSLAFILGGALGNLIDRILYGYVVDFLDFYWGAYHFAAFNVADAAITCGAVLLILDSFKGKKHGNIAG